ncbi:NB-ARC domain-containing protein [Plantactinospora sp. CA-290183]|uniref:NB-ARC domain-containing protein n=1 Tax=Plantactinospora sp. CA-290183 TaxID=3240006 RepID=UPI003D8EC475
MSGRSTSRSADGPGVRNVAAGTVGGTLVQAGAVHGGIHLHHDGAALFTVLPRQLPPRPHLWVDRGRELADLDQALDEIDQRSVLVLLTGLGGIGKTALAVRWAHRTASAFPDGQLYLNLDAGSAGPAPAAEALGQLLRAMGVPAERIPANPAEQTALWRSVAAGRRLLILVDNAVASEQVRPLLPGTPGCVFLVTARTLISGLLIDGARIITVRPLDPSSAHTLLRQAIPDRRSDHDLAAAADLARLCAGMPLALTVVAAHLLCHPHRPVAGLVSDLTAEQQRLARLQIGDLSVTAALDVAYQALPSTAARAYRLVVGVHPGSRFGGPVATAVLNARREETANMLDELVRAHLLTQTGADSYQYDDLPGVHARQLAADDPERAPARRRMLTWYLAATRTADEILTPYRHRTPITDVDLPPDPAGFNGDRDRTLDWLEHERPNLVAACQTCSADLPDLVYLIADAMWPLFHLRRHHTDRAVVDQIAVDCARRLANPAFEAAMLRRQGYAHYDTGHLDEASRVFDRSLQLAEALPDLSHVVLGSVAGLGLVALAHRRLTEAAAHFGRELDLATAAGKLRAIGLAHWHLGQTYRHAGHPERAVDHLTRATQVLADLGDTDRYNMALVRIELGRALADSGKPEQGATTLHQALTEMTRLGSPRGRAQALHAFGDLATHTSHHAEAIDHLTQAHQIYTALGDAEAAEVEDQLRSLRQLPAMEHHREQA